jgi:transposase InsO family protein
VVKPKPRLNAYQRYLICSRVHLESWRVSAAARAAGVSRQTAHKWLRRFRTEGEHGLADRSSRPWRTPRQTRIDLAAQICSERLRRRWGPHRLAYALGMPRSTVYAVLRRAQLSRLGALRVRRAVLRYEWPQCGDLVHLDTKRLGRIAPDGGWRNRGRRGGDGQRALRRPRSRYEYCHVAVDDHSRLPLVQIHPDELPASAVATLEHTWSTYLRAGVRIKRVLTDNGNCYRSLDFAAACARLSIRHWRTRPYTPRTNGKAERFIKTLQERWVYARLYRSSDERAQALPAFLAEFALTPHTGLDGHTPACRFAAVNDVSGNHT